MMIDIDRLTEAELIDLNHRVVERLRFLQQARAHKQMLEFRIGDRVAFQADGRGTVEGILTRYNRKSVTVITDDGHHWNVAPGFLVRVTAPADVNPPGPPKPGPPEVVPRASGPLHGGRVLQGIEAKFSA